MRLRLCSCYTGYLCLPTVTTMTTRWVVNANILYTLMQLDNSKHRSRAISRLFEGRKTHVLSCSIDYSHPLSPYSCSPRNAWSSSFLSARHVAQNRKRSKHFLTKNTSQYPWRGEEIRDVPGLKGLALLWLIGAQLFDAGEICELKLHTATCLASHYVGKRHRTNNEPQNRIINVCVKKMKKSLSSNGSHGQPVVTCYWMRPRPSRWLLPPSRCLECIILNWN